MSDSEKTLRVMCAECGHQYRNHRILHEKPLHYCDGPFEPTHLIVYHRFVECMGCDSLKYVTSKQDPLQDDPEERMEYDFKVYPDAPDVSVLREPAFGLEEAEIPSNVWKMYTETLQAVNTGIRTLAGGGLRATVEAICLDSGITSGSLQQKIDELANKNLLTKSQAELLHEERYLGNAALHEMETPSTNALEDGLGIVEGLINTIYILPDKAKRLRHEREKKDKSPSRKSH